MKKIIIVTIAALILVSGGYLLRGDNSNEALNEEEKADVTASQEDISTESINQATSVEVVSSGLGYVDYNEDVFAGSSESKRILFFHAPWCSVCNFYEGQIEEQGVPSDVTILKIDYDSEDDLKAKYNVTTQSTFVFLDEGGAIVKSWPFARGLSSIQDLYSQI